MSRTALTESQKKDRKLLRTLNAYKRENRITHRETAKALNCSEHTVSLILNGHTDITIRALRIMLQLFGVPVEEIINLI